MSQWSVIKLRYRIAKTQFGSDLLRTNLVSSECFYRVSNNGEIIIYIKHS